MAKYHEAFCIYKANSKGTGSAAQFQLGSKKDCVFLELANQIRPKDDVRPYDWDSKIIVKLGQADIGKFLLLLAGGPALELFHKNEKGNKIVKVAAQDNGYYLRASAQEGGGQPVAVSLPISWDEAVLLKLALERAFKVMLGW